jgi:Predicted signal-transduction protein containing cAMP-binding and CBS domains
MRIQDVMSKRVISVAPETEVAEVEQKLRNEEVDHLVVMNGKKVVGVVTGEDLVGISEDRPVSAAMSKHVVTIKPGTTLRRAAGIMRGRAIGCLPVVDEGSLVGIVTVSDLLTALARGAVHEPPQRERIVLNKRGPRRGPVTF